MTLRTSRLYLRPLQVVYDLVYGLLLIVGSPVVLVMLVVSRRWRAGLLQRFGFCPGRPSGRPAIWIHGVSVGEVLAAQELVRLLEREVPGVDVVLSTTTWAAQVAAHRAYAGHLVFYYPLDFSFATHRVVRRIRPAVVLLMELEIWPNFLLTTSLRRVPVLLANGRMSAKSQRDYLWMQRLIPEPMDRVVHYCVQTEEYAARFRAVGVPPERLTITGSMKFDTVPDDLPDDVRASYARRLAIAPGAFVLMGGSTHAGEEEVVLDAYDAIRRRDPNARLVLVPRFPERFAEVEAVVRARGLPCVRLSTLPAGGPAADPPAGVVVLGDTVGELSKLYVVADLVFVGGTLTRRGGQNMMEPAGLGKPVVVGPATWNFRDPVELLLSRGGLVQVRDADEVRSELLALHADPGRRRLVGESARGICRESKGATRRILDILLDHVPRTPVEVAS
jgi:3-deoxy-D-manno-octulosonic-acid transferase